MLIGNGIFQITFLIILYSENTASGETPELQKTKCNKGGVAEFKARI